VLDDAAGITFKPSFARDAFVPTDAAGVDRLLALLTPHPPRLPSFIMRSALRRFASRGSVIQQSMDSMLAGGDLLDTRLSGIRKPTLIVWGTKDVLIPISVGETMHQDITNSVLLGVEGCGHLAPGECAKPVLAGTIQFLGAQPAMQGGDYRLPDTAGAVEHLAASSGH
jgi:pimeloyl-ACP methyl ester carboxylesterase